MIEQVFYRREQSGGYKEYRSASLSKEDAHAINLILNNMSTYISNLDSGQDAPMFIFPVVEQNKYCIAKLSGEFYGGRKNQVQHGLLMSHSEYWERTKKPETIFGFTNKNFISVKANKKNEMVSLKEFMVDENKKFNVANIIKNYNLNNKSFITFLSAIYTTLSQNKEYTCGVVMESAKNSLELFKEFGYCIMSMLPYPLRGKISFSSTGAPISPNITLQILKNSDNKENLDVVYHLDTYEIDVKEYVEINNFYLEDLLEMTDQDLKDYFEFMDAFDKELGVSKDTGTDYIISKLAKLYKNPDLFRQETTADQLLFVKEVLGLNVENDSIIKKIAIKLLSYVDPEKHLEVFYLNYDLYKNLQMSNVDESKMKSEIEKNLVQSFADCLNNEKIELFKKIYESNSTHNSVYNLIERLLYECDNYVSYMLTEELLLLFDEAYMDRFAEIICEKIEDTFTSSNIKEKVVIWNKVINLLASDKKFVMAYRLLDKTDVLFQKEVITTLISLYEEGYGKYEDDLIDCYYGKIIQVFEKASDKFLLSILHKNRNVSDSMDSLWLEGYKRIKNVKKLQSDSSFINDLEYKYYHSKNEELKKIYLQHIVDLPQGAIEKKIHDVYTRNSNNIRNQNLLTKILMVVVERNIKLSIKTLKELICLLDIDDTLNAILSEYIRNYYLNIDNEENNEIYAFLEEKKRSIFDSIYLAKEELSSYDRYYATKLSSTNVATISALVNTLDELEHFSYHRHTFEQLKYLYSNALEKGFEECNTDLERYELCKEYELELRSIQSSTFAQEYGRDLAKQYIHNFWEASNIETFDYKNRYIYGKKKGLYCKEFAEHENYILAEKLDNIFQHYPINWDDVYRILLTNKVIKNNNIRAQIASEFLIEYEEYGADLLDKNYIALKNVDVKSLKMRYQTFFAELQSNEYSLNSKKLQEMCVFTYINTGAKFKKELKNYRNYRSKYPNYNEVHGWLWLSQFIFLIVLLGNNMLYQNNLEMNISMNLRTSSLLINYIVFMGIVIIVSILTLFLLRKIRLRDSYKFDSLVFMLVAINYILIVMNVILSILISSFIISSIITVITIIITMVVNFLCKNAIKKEISEVRKRSRNSIGGQE